MRFRRSRLIANLSTKSAMSNPGHDTDPPHISRGILQQIPTPLKEADYPYVKYWHHRRRDKARYTPIKVTSKAINDDDESSESDSDDAASKRKEKVFPFLEKENGEVICASEKDVLYDEVRAWWNDNITAARTPRNWSSAGATLRDKFRLDIEAKFPFLRLCSGHWKVDELWKRNYHSWKTTFLQRIEKAKKRTRNHEEDMQTAYDK
jgi:hypothetical protein